MSIQYQRFARCGVDNCKTTLYYVEDGQCFCKNGHRREGELEIAEDEFTTAPTGARVKTAQEAKVKVARLLSGRKASTLYIKCLQLILRKQVWLLVHNKGFPAQLEVAVRDLWALRLQKLLERHKAHSQHGLDLDSTMEQSEEDTVTGLSHDDDYSSDYLSSDVEVDNAIAAELDVRKRRLLLRQKRQFKLPSLLTTLSLCYLGAILLRAPLTLGEIVNWVDNHELLYTHALQEIPVGIARSLPGSFIIALKPVHRIEPRGLQSSIHDLVILFFSQFGLSFPGLNWPIFTMKYIRDLGLPLETYLGVKQLIAASELTFTFNGAPRLKKQTIDIPEAKLMALVLISSKLAWDLDGMKHTSRDLGEPSAMKIDHKAWELFLAENKFKGDSLYDYDDKDILAMSGQELDAYMDWYERNWLNSNTTGQTNVPEAILSMFPTGRSSANGELQGSFTQNLGSPTSRIQKLFSSVTSKRNDSFTEAMRPGTRYIRWNSGSSLTPQAKMMLDAASALVCISREDLLVSTGQMERIMRRSRVFI